MSRLVPPMASLLIAVIACLPGAFAADGDSLRIEQPWSRATPPGATVGVGYLVIVNDGEVDDRLVRAESPMAARVMLHRSVEADGTMRMEHQGDGIPVPAGGRVALEPGGYHLMLMQIRDPFGKGERVPVTLVFEQAGRIEIELDVRGLAEVPE